jgi:hypothetical protein
MITPFEIFYYQARDEALRMNPDVRGIQLTALLGRLWRALDPATRAHFGVLSMHLRGNPQVKIPKQSFTARRRRDQPLSLPTLGVLPHGEFGWFAAEVSGKLLNDAEREYQA